jgi:hypothetical protein
MGLLTLTGIVLGAGALLGSPQPWDGTNPFADSCVLQQAGFEATGPDPGAEPYCVEFDKRQQNLDRLGLVDFVLKEPARVAAAVGKCRYFQADHWRGSIVQADGRTKTYEFDGRYFFDKSTGNGGVSIENFNVNGRSGDPSAYLPPGLREFTGPGRFGAITRNALPFQSACR